MIPEYQSKGPFITEYWDSLINVFDMKTAMAVYDAVSASVYDDITFNQSFALEDCFRSQKETILEKLTLYNFGLY